MRADISITNKTKGTIPVVPFAMLKEAVLGKHYDLSLVFVGDAAARKLNLKHRGKDKPTNILSFPLDDCCGEIFIDLPLCKKQCADFGRPYSNFIAFLFIHGLFHLKGYEHGSRMERAERAIRKKFGI